MIIRLCSPILIEQAVQRSNSVARVADVGHWSALLPWPNNQTAAPAVRAERNGEGSGTVHAEDHLQLFAEFPWKNL